MRKHLTQFLTLLCFIIGWQPTIVKAQDIYEDKFQWQIPGGKYIDPVSFFSIHGYVNAVFASGADEWMLGNFNGIGMPGQVIVPNSNVPSFSNDEAIWISSELSERASVMMEIHLVADPSNRGAAGPGGLTLVLTEANIRYNLIKQYLSISAGTFWSVFGIQNQDWLGAQNLFSTIPLASGAYITHYNEKGIRLDGSIGSGDWGMNYVLSVGNGFNAYDIMGYTSFDVNANKMVNGRVSIFPGFGEDLNVGLSYGNGMLFEQDMAADTTSKQYFTNRFEALGIDLTYHIKHFNLRSYLITSNERLSNDSRSMKLPALGWMGELSYDITLQPDSPIDAISPKVRFDYLDKIQFDPLASDVYQTISFGVNVKLRENYLISMDYNIANEANNAVNNDRFIMRASASF